MYIHIYIYVYIYIYIYIYLRGTSQGLTRNMRETKLSCSGAVFVFVKRASCQITGIDYPVCASV